MYLLDTNHCSRLLAGDEHVTRRLATLGDAPVATSVIVRGELMFMAEHSDQREINLQRIEAFLSTLDVFPIDTATADWYGTLKAALIAHFGPKERAKRRRATIQLLGISENDLWIAAIAKRHGSIVVSSDRDFDRIAAVTDLTVETWIAPPREP
jgi:tRNA(fMet)-specific endonuclease VapC